MSKAPPAARRAAHLLLLLALAACAPEGPAPEAAAPDARRASADPGSSPGQDLAARAEAAGLSEAQAQGLVDLGVPVVVPVLPEGWALADFDAEAEEYDGFRYPYYRLAYRHADGACFALQAASEGIGDVFVEEPPHTREADVPGVATYGPARLGWADEGEVDAEWDVPYVRSEWFGADGLAVSLGSDAGDGCRRITPDAAVALLAGLRYLDPDDDALALGPLAFVDLADPPIGELANGPTPEATALQAFGQAEGESLPRTRSGGATATAVEVLRQRPGHAVVLVTTTDLPDDSVRDERVRAVLLPGDEGWLLTEAGRQVRCREGRGHQEWSADRCL